MASDNVAVSVGDADAQRAVEWDFVGHVTLPAVDKQAQVNFGNCQHAGACVDDGEGLVVFEPGDDFVAVVEAVERWSPPSVRADSEVCEISNEL